MLCLGGIMTCILEKEDYVLLDSLIRISDSIGKIYQNLFQLEISGKKNSSEYIKYLDYLSIAREVEQKMYDKNDMNALKCCELLKYILSQEMMDNISDDQSLIKANYREGKVRRVYNILNGRMVDDTKGMVYLMRKYNETDFTIPQEVVEINYKGKVIERIIDKERNMLFLGILLHNIPENLIKRTSDLVNLKYYLAFINIDVEQELMLSSFKVDEKVPLLSNVIADCYGMKQTEYYTLQNIYGFSHSLQQVNHLLTFDDLHYLSSECQYQSYIYSSLLRSYMTFLSDISVLELNKKFNDILNSKAKEKIKHYISERIIKRCFYNIYIDRNNQMVLKLVK